MMIEDLISSISEWIVDLSFSLDTQIPTYKKITNQQVDPCEEKASCTGGNEGVAETVQWLVHTQPCMHVNQNHLVNHADRMLNN